MIYKLDDFCLIINFSVKCLLFLYILFVSIVDIEYGLLLNCLCVWGRVFEVLEFINEWIIFGMSGIVKDIRMVISDYYIDIWYIFGIK